MMSQTKIGMYYYYNNYSYNYYEHVIRPSVPHNSTGMPVERANAVGPYIVLHLLILLTLLRVVLVSATEGVTTQEKNNMMYY